MPHSEWRELLTALFFDLSLITEWVKLLANQAKSQQNKLFLSSKYLFMCTFSFSTLFCSLIIKVANHGPTRIYNDRGEDLTKPLHGDVFITF